MEELDRLVVMELERMNKRLMYQSRINSQLSRRIKNTNIANGILIGILGYSVYVQASKIEMLVKEIDELKSEKGD